MDKFTVNVFLDTCAWFNLFNLQCQYINVPWFCNIFLRPIKWSWLMGNTEHPETYIPCKWFVLDTNIVSSNFSSFGSLSCSEFNECCISQSCVTVSPAVPVVKFVTNFLTWQVPEEHLWTGWIRSVFHRNVRKMVCKDSVSFGCYLHIFLPHLVNFSFRYWSMSTETTATKKLTNICICSQFYGYSHSVLKAWFACCISLGSFCKFLSLE